MGREALQNGEAGSSVRVTSCVAKVLSATAWSAASAGAQTRSKITKALGKLIIQVLLYKRCHPANADRIQELVRFPIHAIVQQRARNSVHFKERGPPSAAAYMFGN